MSKDIAYIVNIFEQDTTKSHVKIVVLTILIFIHKLDSIVLMQISKKIQVNFHVQNSTFFN